MADRIKNVAQHPKVYFGLHMAEGVAHYKPEDGDEFTIFVGEQAAKALDPTYTGKPAYVYHVDEVNLNDLEKEADGYVVKSFYNPCDGKHWCEFIIVSDRGHEAMKMGWKLSNAYEVSQYGPGGCWHGVDYSKEVLNATYEHLAIVPDPRYSESIILTPEEFKLYNEKKKNELEMLKNSNNKKIVGEKTMFNLFTKKKVENSADLNLNELMLTLPKSGRDVSLAQLVEMAEQEPNEKTILNSSHDIYKVGKIKMTVKQLVDEYAKLINTHDMSKMHKNISEEDKEAYANMGDDEKKAYDKKNISDEEYKKKYSNADEDKDKEKEEYANMDEDEKKAYDKKNMSDEEYKKKYKEENEDDEDEIQKKQNKNKNAFSSKVVNAEKALEKAKREEENFNKIANAELNASYVNDAPTVDLGSDKTARGKARYGSD